MGVSNPSLPSGTPPRVMINTGSPEMLGNALASGQMGAFAAALGSAAYNANEAYFVPFVITKSVTVHRLFVINGALAGNSDMGIYDENFALIVSTGSLAAGVVGTPIGVFNIADTVLQPGRYYLAWVNSNNGASSVYAWLPEAVRLRVAGCFQQANALPLPNPAVPAVAAQQFLPLIGLALRNAPL